MKLIKRTKYLNELIAVKSLPDIKVITGIRRSGKSYLLFNLYYKYLLSTGVSEDNIIAIPLDDDDFAAYRDPHELYEYIKSKLKNQKQQYYIFIDEIQHIKHFEEVVAAIRVSYNCSLFITGSNSRFLSSDSPNLRCTGINGLALIIQINPGYVMNHQKIIVDCLK